MNLKLIHVAGYPRSGTTLIARLLGQTLHGFVVGEAFDAFFIRNEYESCGCRENVNQCRFWGKILRLWDQAESIKLRALAGYVARTRYFLWFMFPQIASRKFFAASQELSLKASELYRHIQDVSRISTIIESSKLSVLSSLLQNQSIDIRVVHIVRDSRAVAYSNVRRPNQPDPSLMRGGSRLTAFAKCAVHMMLHELFFTYLSLVALKWLSVRYEDFVETPTQVMRSVAKFAGVNDIDLTCFLADQKIILEESHSLLGNRMKFNKGIVELRLDSDWQDNMSWLEKLLVTCITAPILLFHGYPLWAPGSRADIAPK